MNDVITIQGIDGFEENGLVQLRLEPCVRGLGFTTVQTIGGKEYTNVRWARVDEYLADLGFATSGKNGERPEFIPESIFYRLAMKAKNEAAEKFQAKIADEIIPAIRKHGGYLTPEMVDKVLSDPDTIIKLATDLKAERQKRLEAEKQRDILIHVQKTFTTTEIAKEIGFRSAIQLNRWLEANGVQFKQNGTWVLYSKYAELGYTEIKQSVLDSGKIVYDRRWTNEGRDFILRLMGEEYENADTDAI